jgi:hypothetical protein
MSVEVDRSYLGQLFAELMATRLATSLPGNESWPELIQRISVPGRINEITEDVYWYFLEVLPPRLFNGNRFCFAEGDEPLRLFWRRGRHYFCRQLTQQESDYVSELSRQR